MRGIIVFIIFCLSMANAQEMRDSSVVLTRAISKSYSEQTNQQLNLTGDEVLTWISWLDKTASKSKKKKANIGLDFLGDFKTSSVNKRTELKPGKFIWTDKKTDIVTEKTLAKDMAASTGFCLKIQVPQEGKYRLNLYAGGSEKAAPRVVARINGYLSGRTLRGEGVRSFHIVVDFTVKDISQELELKYLASVQGAGLWLEATNLVQIGGSTENSIKPLTEASKAPVVKPVEVSPTKIVKISKPTKIVESKKELENPAFVEEKVSSSEEVINEDQKLFLLITVPLLLWPVMFFPVFKKAGFPTYFAFSMLIPPLGLIILVTVRWPAHKELNAYYEEIEHYS